ncbi:MAG: hypothetical protein J2P17_35890, partial [Mycobacterium sp.]|nr:hypothetical protein [Mycobacterium sp.]
VCGGPWIPATPGLLGLIVATLVWHHQPARPLERWQLRACLTILAEAAADRAREAEADVTWHHEVVTALISSPPGDEGWDAYKTTHRFPREYATWQPHRQITALRLAYSRLEILEQALPNSFRPDRPQPLRAIDSARQVAPTDDLQQGLHEWFSALRQVCREDLPDIDLLLFTLPGAVRTW